MSGHYPSLEVLPRLTERLGPRASLESSACPPTWTSLGLGRRVPVGFSRSRRGPPVPRTYFLRVIGDVLSVPVRPGDPASK